MSNLAITNISWKYYLIFICLNAIDFIIIALFFPETKGNLDWCSSFQEDTDRRETQARHSSRWRKYSETKSTRTICRIPARTRRWIITS